MLSLLHFLFISMQFTHSTVQREHEFTPLLLVFVYLFCCLLLVALCETWISCSKVKFFLLFWFVASWFWRVAPNWRPHQNESKGLWIEKGKSSLLLLLSVSLYMLHNFNFYCMDSFCTHSVIQFSTLIGTWCLVSGLSAQPPLLPGTSSLHSYHKADALQGNLNSPLGLHQARWQWVGRTHLPIRWEWDKCFSKITGNQISLKAGHSSCWIRKKNPKGFDPTDGCMFSFQLL